MAQFDMRGQAVTNQYVAGHDINFSGVQNTEDLTVELEQLIQYFMQARKSHIISEEIATDAQYQVTKAILQVKKPDPDKRSILNYLNTTKEMIEGITSASGLVQTQETFSGRAK